MLNYKIYHKSNDIDASWFVFLAGFTGTYETWNMLCDKILEKHNISILLIDNLGAGKSSQPSGEYTTVIMAEKVFEVIIELKLNNITLVGHSLGGAIAQQIAINNPKIIKNLILLSSFAKLDFIAQHFLISRYELSKANVDKNLIAKAAIPSIFGNEFLTNESNIKLAIQRVVDNPQTLDGMFGQLSACLSHDTTKIIQEINCPTKIISGANDILVAPNHSTLLNLLIPKSSLCFIPNCGHMIQLEKPNELLAMLI